MEVANLIVHIVAVLAMIFLFIYAFLQKRKNTLLLNGIIPVLIKHDERYVRRFFVSWLELMNLKCSLAFYEHHPSLSEDNKKCLSLLMQVLLGSTSGTIEVLVNDRKVLLRELPLYMNRGHWLVRCLDSELQFLSSREVKIP